MTSACRSEAGIDADDGVDGGEVGVAGVGRRGADGDEQQARAPRARRRCRVEKCRRSRLRSTISARPGLVDRDLAVLEALDLVRVDVDAVDLVAELGEARRGDEADVAGADDADGFAVSAHEARRLATRQARACARYGRRRA